MCINLFLTLYELTTKKSTKNPKQNISFNIIFFPVTHNLTKYIYVAEKFYFLLLILCYYNKWL